MGTGRLVAIAVALAALAGVVAPASAATAAAPPRFVPYVDMTLSSESLARMMSESGVRGFSLGFIVSGQPCRAAWGGYYGIGDPVMNRRISRLQEAGGNPIVSFGGAAGRELANTCGSVAGLAAQYQAVIDRYGIRHLDFDVEGADLGNEESIVKRFRAIARVQAEGRDAGKPVRASLTLPVMPTGLSDAAVRVVHSARKNGARITVVNIMAMDYYDPSLDYKGRMGDYAIQAARATHSQLSQMYPDRSGAAIWRMIGVTPMIGVNDDPEEVFTTNNARQLTAFAQRRHLGRLAMWSSNRDHPCPGTKWASNTCTGLAAPDWAFSRIFRAFVG
jgi:hypothetical protein